jgi:phage shock protein PspC (stress-responsive transcriptional regulator)
MGLLSAIYLKPFWQAHQHKKAPGNIPGLAEYYGYLAAKAEVFLPR